MEQVIAGGNCIKMATDRKTTHGTARNSRPFSRCQEQGYRDSRMVRHGHEIICSSPRDVTPPRIGIVARFLHEISSLTYVSCAAWDPWVQSALQSSLFTLPQLKLKAMSVRCCSLQQSAAAASLAVSHSHSQSQSQSQWLLAPRTIRSGRHDAIHTGTTAETPRADARVRQGRPGREREREGKGTGSDKRVATSD